MTFLQAVANVLANVFERAAADERMREVRVAERQRIARALHDEALQELTYALTVAQRWWSGPAPVSAAP